MLARDAPTQQVMVIPTDQARRLPAREPGRATSALALPFVQVAVVLEPGNPEALQA
jgi:hypothetical protein